MFQRSRRFRRTTVITVGLLAFLLGLGFARTNLRVDGSLILASALFFIVTAKRLRFAAVMATLLLGFTFGWWRGQTFLREIAPMKSLVGQHVVATVQADSDATYDERKQLAFDASQLHVSDPENMIFPGRLAVSGFGEPAVYKGDVVQIEGKVFESRGSRQLRMSFAELTVLGRSASPVDNARRQFAAGMETALPEPQASFGLGLLIGQRNTLLESTLSALSAVGLTHIIAVSGYNLTIIMRAVKRGLLGRSKFQIAVLSIALMGLFLLVTGFSASIVRAAIVSGMSLAAWYYGRNIRPLLILALAASLTAGWNPFYIWSDIGWYLSFLAFFGVLIVAPLINKRLFSTEEPRQFTAIMTESFCALVLTVPLVLLIFSQISLIALVANLLVVPLVPLAMLLALIAGLAGMILPTLAGLLALPARIILTYMLDIAELLSRVPNALVERKIELTHMLFLYSCILVFVLILWRATEKKHAIISSETSGEKHVRAF